MPTVIGKHKIAYPIQLAPALQNVWLTGFCPPKN